MEQTERDPERIVDDASSVIEVAGTRRPFEGVDIRSEIAECLDYIVGGICGPTDGAAFGARESDNKSEFRYQPSPRVLISSTVRSLGWT